MPNTHTGVATTFYDDVDYPADGDDADEASISPLEKVQDNTSYLKAEIEDDVTGIVALNTRVDALAALNFPYDDFQRILADSLAAGTALEIYDFDRSANLNLYGALVFANSTSTTMVYYSSDLHHWTKDIVTLAGSDPPANMIMGSAAALTAAWFQWNSTNLKIVKWQKGVGITATATTLSGSGSFATNPHGGGYINSTFVWGMWDGLNNAIIVTSTTATSVSRQAFGTNGDLNHIRGPMVIATDATDAGPATILVAIGNALNNGIVQNQSFFLTTTDGITFTERVFPAVTPGNEQFGGVDYNADQGCFFAASTDMTTHALNVYKSVDGLTWTVVKTLAAPGPSAFLNWQVTAIASAGTVILATVAATSALSGKQYFVYSADLGATWRCVPKFNYTPSGSLVNELRAKLRAAVGQIVFGNGSCVMGSLTLGLQGSVVT
jgi:hypothetical protein